MLAPSTCQTAQEVREAARRACQWRQQIWGRPSKPEPASGTVTPPRFHEPIPTIKPPAYGRLTTRKIIRAAAAVFDITEEELTGNCRQVRVVLPRQAAMTVARRLTQNSFPELGRKFGGRDHTTIMHALRKFEHDAKLKEAVGKLLAALASPSEEEGGDGE
jgi:chromosomal replication initiator protein